MPNRRLGRRQRYCLLPGLALLVAILAGLSCAAEDPTDVDADGSGPAADAGADSRADSSSDPALDAGVDSGPADGAQPDLDAVSDPTDADSRDALDVADLSEVTEDADGGEPGPIPPPLPEIGLDRLTALQDQLDEILSDPSVSGRRLSALVVEGESGRVLYAADPDLTLAPASNTKLFTTAAALSLLGEDYRFRTGVWADASPDADGIVDGDLYLLGEHDFTFSAHFYESARFPFDRIAQRLYADGLREVTGTVWVMGELLYGGYRYAAYDPSAHRAAAATNFTAALSEAGIEVGASDTSASFEVPTGAVHLLDWWSVPLSVACSPLNSISHNEFADILMRHLGYRFGGESSYPAGTDEVKAWLGSIGVDTTGFALFDGSGLSHANRVSARQVIGLLQALRETPLGPVWTGTFSIAGVRGTLTNRLTGPETSGRVFAKTGTLSISIALSGVLINRHDGRQTLFSFLINDQPDQSAARAVLDEAVAALAVDLLGTGGRPAAPELRWVVNDGTGTSVTVSWEGGEGAEGYYLWASPSGRVWRREEALYTVETTEQLTGLDAGAQVVVRVTAVDEAGGESDPSDVYAARVTAAPSPLLLVDGNERWQREPASENTLSTGHAFLVRYGEAIEELAYDSASNGAVAAGAVSLDDYDAVVWAVAEDSVDDHSFDLAEQTLLATYTGGGGDLFVTGAEIGWDLVEYGTADEVAFFNQTLRAEYVGDDADTYYVEGSGGIFSDLSLMGFYTPDGIDVRFPDQLSPRGGSVASLEYVGGAGGVAAVQYDGDYRLIYFGFPFESIDGAPERADVMSRVLAFFDL